MKLHDLGSNLYSFITVWEFKNFSTSQIFCEIYFDISNFTKILSRTENYLTQYSVEFSVRFYVKSILETLKGLKLPFLAIVWTLNLVILVHFIL